MDVKLPPLEKKTTGELVSSSVAWSNATATLCEKSMNRCTCFAL